MQAREILAQDAILVNLVGADKKADSGLALTYHFDGTGRQISPNRGGARLTIPRAGREGARPPLPPTDAITRVIQENGPREAERIQELMNEYNRELATFRAAGNKPLSDALVDSVFAFIAENTEIDTQGGGNKWNVRRDQVLVRVPNRVGDEGVVFTVQPTPVWGRN